MGRISRVRAIVAIVVVQLIQPIGECKEDKKIDEQKLGNVEEHTAE